MGSNSGGMNSEGFVPGVLICKVHQHASRSGRTTAPDVFFVSLAARLSDKAHILIPQVRFRAIAASSEPPVSTQLQPYLTIQARDYNAVPFRQ